ncbi:uncharacterized protein LOC110239139 [Exaiptasia diaphana]|uniref:Peptidase aspartic putative domain-containing protein n=1 Tax=Exaiptasia diaphana TaxID=2652724 RepID=A0A913YEL8_EXADI|nr:uncharacterized protein LOC110239139 [Exaiptasia diaphana]
MCNNLQSEITSLRTNIYTAWDPKSAQEAADRIVNDWKHFEEIYNEYLTGIKEKGRLETVQTKYMLIKELASNVFDEFKRQLQVNEQAATDDVFEIASVRSDCNNLPASSQRQKLRTMLLAKRKLELAKSRQREEIENARILHEMTARKEIRKLEEEAALAEVEWQVETECVPNEEIQTKAYDDHGNIKHSTPNIGAFKPYQTTPPAMSTLKPNVVPPDNGHPPSPVFNLQSPVNWRQGYVDERNLAGKRAPFSDGQQTPAAPHVPVYDGQQTPAAQHVPVYDGQQTPATPHVPVYDGQQTPAAPHVPVYDGQQTPAAPHVPVYDGQQTPAAPHVPVYDGQQTSAAPRASVIDNKQDPSYLSTTACNAYQATIERYKPMDHIATMLKIQLLNGIKPTQFSGKPADFPFLRKQLREHLETEHLSDAQRVEYLPKFLCGEALEVVKRNRGCSYQDLVNILETRYGQPIQVSQACIEELISGPKLNYGDNVGLLNFAETLTTATKILTGADEKEISVATNLRRIVNRLPNDLVSKWQSVNYEILCRGSFARLKDISDFVRKHATIRNDPVYGLPKRENKDTKGNTRTMAHTRHPAPRVSTVATASVQKDIKEASSAPKDRCEICKDSPHNLKVCPIIKQCDHVDVRRHYAAAYQFCFNCGKQRPGHGSGTCPDTPSCTRCNGRHLDILHKDRLPGRLNPPSHSNDKAPARGDKKPGQPQDAKKPDLKPQPKGVKSAAVQNSNSSVVLNVLPVVVTSSDNRSLSTYAFLDNGCTDTLIDRQLADELGLTGRTEEIEIVTITSTQEAESKRVNFTIKAINSDEKVKVNDAYVLADLRQYGQVLPESVDTSTYTHLQDIKFSSVDLPRISVLIGSNIPSAHVQREVRIPDDGDNGLYGYHYSLGWTLCGPIDAISKDTVSVNSISMDCQLDEALEKFWKLEDNVISGAKKELSVDDKRALRIISETTRFVDGHYEVGLPWKDAEPNLPDNRRMAEKRLEMLKRRLLKPENADLALKYRDTMQGYIDKGYARKLTEDEVKTEGQVRWYLPHHPVTNPNKPGKVRIVFDAAAEYEGASLNKALLQGPDSTNSLIGVLLRFRKGNVALAADVESMFHQVRVPNHDQQALRFLWWTRGYDEPPDVYVMQVHIFGATSSPCVVNSTLRRAADDNADNFSEETVAAVKQNFYVDDGLPSCSDTASAITLANQMTDLLNRGGFNLTKFTSNCKDVLASIPTPKRAKPELDLDLDELPVERALGVRWYPESDELGFTIKDLDRPETKRGILSTVCSLYDPLGIAGPVVLQAKNLLQDLWRAKVGWDDPLADEFLNRWREWKDALQIMADVRIPRCYFSLGIILSDCKLQIHHFADASEHGYGTVSYLRVKNPDGYVQCSFLMGKSRNAPVKFTSVPRLELQAAVLATRVNNTIRSELDLHIEKARYWTDSAIVLHYLRNPKLRLQTFVANRVQEISENSSVDEWRHVSGALNPADDVSRGYGPSQLSSDGRWLRGPDFLWRDESMWPDEDINAPAEEVLELKKIKHVNIAAVKPKENSPPQMSELQLLIESCSDWTTLLRRFAWLSRFVQYIRNRKDVPRGNLTLDEIENAELQVVKIAQRTCYKDEIKALHSAKGVNQTSNIATLNPVLDNQQLLRREVLDPSSKSVDQIYTAKMPHLQKVKF